MFRAVVGDGFALESDTGEVRFVDRQRGVQRKRGISFFGNGDSRRVSTGVRSFFVFIGNRGAVRQRAGDREGVFRAVVGDGLVGEGDAGKGFFTFRVRCGVRIV